MQKKTNGPKKSPDPDKNKQGKGFIRYTDIAFRMIVIILIGVLGGVKLDEWLELKTPIFTLVLSLLSTAAAMYVVIKEVSK